MMVTITSSSSNRFLRFGVQCCDSKPRQRGFGSRNNSNTNKNKRNKVTTSREREEKGVKLQARKSTTIQSGRLPTEAPRVSSCFEGKPKRSTSDIEFEERLHAVRRSALEQKKANEIKEFGPIDYDALVESEKKTIGLGTKIGIGVAVLVFGLVFTFGDFLPSVSDGPTEESTIVSKKLSEEERTTLQTRLKQYEATLSVSPKDPIALEGTAVTLAELSEYSQAGSLLQELAKKPKDPYVFRLLGKVKYGLKDYEGSAAAYKSSAMVFKNVNFEVLRGLTNSLLAAKKPDEAVEVLPASRACLNSEKSTAVDAKADSSTMETESPKLHPIQVLNWWLVYLISKLESSESVGLLLGKAYLDWGHVSDAVSVYDQLICSHPNDFRGYLAKGIILKENGNVGDAERMFIQARFFVPENAKALVDHYARR